MSDTIDPLVFKDLAACDPGDVCQRTGAGYDPDSRKFTLGVWGSTWEVLPEQNLVCSLEGSGRGYRDYLELFIVHYLIRARDIPLAGDWVSEKDLPGGAAFFRGPHALPTNGIVTACSDDTLRFRQACDSLGGRTLAMGDAGVVFDITPRIPVAVLFWQGDDEFPGAARLLFDSSVADHLPLDIIYALAVAVCRSIRS